MASRIRNSARVRSAGLVIMVLGTVLVATGVRAQSVEPERFRYSTDSHRVEQYMGQEALVVGEGTAWLDDVDLQDLVIELDIAVPDAFSFMGVRFRAVDDLNHEYFYIRPRQSGREDATQSMPVDHGVGAWQIHTGPAYSAPLQYVADRWMHLKLVVVGRRLEVYLDSNEPVEVVPRLARAPVAGAVGFTSSFVDTRFANIRIRPAGPEDLAAAITPRADSLLAGEVAWDGQDRRTPREDATLVRAFSVSSPFPEEAVAGAGPLDPGAPAWGDLTWHRLEAEPEGIANIARLHGLDHGNTVFAAVTLTSDRPRTVPVRLGFSDRAKVYLNGRPVFAGADEWATRDFRFLGTIGLNDTVYLPLRAGANDLRIAVSEDFGGWGVMLEVPRVDGVEVAPRER